MEKGGKLFILTYKQFKYQCERIGGQLWNYEIEIF